MTPKISEDQRKALEANPGVPIHVVDEASNTKYVLLPDDTYQKVRALAETNEFSPEEFLPLVHDALGDDLDAPGMELYDDYDAHRPNS